MHSRRYLRLLATLLRALLSRGDPRQDRAPQELTTLRGPAGKPELEIALYQSAALSRSRGRTPETVVARQLVHALAEAGFRAVVHYGYAETYEPPEETNDPAVWRWWNDRSPERATHANLLLYDARGGGRAAVRGPNGIAGANRITRLDDANDECDTPQCRNVWACLHEVGHMLGGKHTTPMLEDRPRMHYHEQMVSLLHHRYGVPDVEA